MVAGKVGFMKVKQNRAAENITPISEKQKEEVVDKMAILRDIDKGCECNLTFREVFIEWFQSIQHFQRVKEFLLWQNL